MQGVLLVMVHESTCAIMIQSGSFNAVLPTSKKTIVRDLWFDDKAASKMDDRPIISTL